MGIHVIKMPDIGEGIAEVELVAWNVKVGDRVVEDQNLADVMTDKATVEIPSPVHGVVLSLGGEVGQVLAVGSELLRIEVAGAGNLKAPGGPAASGAATGATGEAYEVDHSSASSSPSTRSSSSASSSSASRSAATG